MSQNQNVSSWSIDSIFVQALELPGCKIDRTQFLEDILSKHKYPSELIEKAIAESPSKAGLDLTAIDKLADECIGYQSRQTALLTFMSALPPGLWALAAIPADLTQLIYNSAVLTQKLIYLYGWPSFDECSRSESANLIKLFFGVMLGVSEANQAVIQLGNQLIKKLPTSVFMQLLTPSSKIVGYGLAKAIAAALGIQLSKGLYVKSAIRVIPFLGAAVSSGLTYVSFAGMATTLKARLRTLAPATGNEQPEVFIG